MPKAPPVKWKRDHFLIGLNLYCKLPFGKLHRGNPIIVETAQKMGRTANSLAMKLCNFASLDPVQQARGIKGLPGATKQDKAMWNEFQSSLPELGPQSEVLLHSLFTNDEESDLDFLSPDRVQVIPPTGPTESLTTVKVRRGQQFFRQTVLNSYGVRCCISGINIPRLLVASHIKPWRDFPSERLDPRNGLCLSNLHDAAFDSGLIALNEERQVMLSNRLKAHFPQPTLEQNFAPFEGQCIRLPDRLAEPSLKFLAYHRQKVFQN